MAQAGAETGLRHRARQAATEAFAMEAQAVRHLVLDTGAKTIRTGTANEAQFAKP